MQKMATSTSMEDGKWNADSYTSCTTEVNLLIFNVVSNSMVASCREFISTEGFAPFIGIGYHRTSDQ